jgi:hypothetical protein
MKIITTIKSMLFMLLLLVNASVFAYGPDADKQACKKPHYTDFSLPVYQQPENKEIPPESEFSFRISSWSDPGTLKLTAKDKPLEYTIRSTSTFHEIKSRLPAEYTGKYVRINSRVDAVLGCYEQIGWLLKVSDKKPE